MDPSFFVAVSFCLFFGFMFGDVGHGLVLIAAAALLQKKKVMSRSMATVLKSAGTASVIFGFLYGSVFGVEDWIPTLWISPMEDMNRLLGVSIGVGVTVITLGMILNMIACYRARDFGRLLFDGRGLAGVILYLSMAAFGYATLTGQPMPFPSWVPWTFLSALLAVILLRDILARLLLRQRTHEEGGLYAFEVLHNLLNFLSNTASFVRLAAFALNHVGLSLAVMMLSDMVRNLPGGIVLKGILLLAGNAVIVGLEGLIVFIQTLRLEYYEFFSKFYRGGGRAFRPVSFSGARVQSKTGPVRNQVSTKGGFAS
jgi:V/A-type H+-transporting ATPase subunit I